MSFGIKGTSIVLTRGDTMKVYATPTNSDGSVYVPSAGDRIRFALKKSFTDKDENVLIVKNIPTDTFLLHLDPSDTKDLSFGGYVYDIELTRENGDVDTYIRGTFYIGEEVL